MWYQSTTYGRTDPERLPFVSGIIVSFIGHLVAVVLTVIYLQYRSAYIPERSVVFSVTLEGGQTLGGVTQIPKEGAKKVLTPEEEGPKPDQVTPEDPKETVTTKEPDPVPDPPPPEKKLTEPSVVDDPTKALEEKKRAEELEKKREEKERQEKEREEKKKVEEKKREEQKKKAEEERKQAEENRKKAEADAKKKAEDEKKARDRKLAEALKRIKNRYEGESADAGGTGFGAAALGGKGMGGGTLASAAKIAYMAALQRHVKAGWRWGGPAGRLVARVAVHISPDGRLDNVRIVQSSGNQSFDDSVVRAVYKASPAPPPPTEYYQEFSDVVFKFDPNEAGGL